MLTSIPHIKSFKMEETRGLYLYLLMSYAYLCGDFPLPDLVYKNHYEDLEVYSPIEVLPRGKHKYQKYGGYQV